MKVWRHLKRIVVDLPLLIVGLGVGALLMPVLTVVIGMLDVIRLARLKDPPEW